MFGLMILAVENALHTLETVEHLLIDVLLHLFQSILFVESRKLVEVACTSLWLVDVYFSVERMSNYVIVAGNCH